MREFSRHTVGACANLRSRTQSPCAAVRRRSSRGARQAAVVLPCRRWHAPVANCGTRINVGFKVLGKIRHLGCMVRMLMKEMSCPFLRGCVHKRYCLPHYRSCNLSRVVCRCGLRHPSHRGSTRNTEAVSENFTSDIEHRFMYQCCFEAVMLPAIGGCVTCSKCLFVLCALILRRLLFARLSCSLTTIVGPQTLLCL